MLEEKACEACGAYFMPSRASQIYCPDCGKNGYKIRRRVEKGIAHSKALDQFYNPTVYDLVCKQCGTSFKSTHQGREFCSSKCRKEYKRERVVCDNCGALLKDVLTDIPDEILDKPHHYCSEKCRKEHKKKLEVSRYGVKKCRQCGKEYVSKNQYFCSRECSVTYRKEYPEVKQKSKVQAVLLPYLLHPTVHQMTAGEKREKEQKKYIRKNGLCGICKTPYSDCERMQSGFRLIPKGAKYADGKIRYCPKYRGPKCG